MVRNAAVFATLLAMGCSEKPRPVGTFTLIEGSRIGKMDIVIVDFSAGFENDSSGIKMPKVPTLYSISFEYPGKTITTMKVFKNGKQVKVCDEAVYEKPRRWPFDNTVIEPKHGKRVDINTGEEDHSLVPKAHNIDCRLEISGGDIEVSLHEFDGMVSKYRLEVLNAR